MNGNVGGTWHHPVMPTPTELLDFERAHPRHNGAKEDAIVRDLRVGVARYYVLLHRAATTTEGITYDPITARLVREHRPHENTPGS